MKFDRAFREIRRIELINDTDNTIYVMYLPNWNKNTRVYITRSETGTRYLEVTSDKGTVPWIPTYPELFSDDWQIDVWEHADEK